jgi:hypothetical protein
MMMSAAAANTANGIPVTLQPPSVTSAVLISGARHGSAPRAPKQTGPAAEFYEKMPNPAHLFAEVASVL